jgi:hypothetical protein
VIWQIYGVKDMKCYVNIDADLLIWHGKEHDIKALKQKEGEHV